MAPNRWCTRPRPVCRSVDPTFIHTLCSKSTTTMRQKRRVGVNQILSRMGGPLNRHCRLVWSDALLHAPLARLRRGHTGNWRRVLRRVCHTTIPTGIHTRRLLYATVYSYGWVVCSRMCTNWIQGFPVDGINIIASQLHSHRTGRRLATLVCLILNLTCRRLQIARNGKFVDNLVTNNHYNHHWQEIRPLDEPIRVFPV
jgi:hypothetical protein